MLRAQLRPMLVEKVVVRLMDYPVSLVSSACFENPSFGIPFNSDCLVSQETLFLLCTKRNPLH